MDAKKAMEIGMKIAEAHRAAVNEMVKYYPHLTTDEAVHGNMVWLGSKIMHAMLHGEASYTKPEEQPRE